MKKTYVISAAVIGLALAAPVSAHHNCAAGEACPDTIGDMMGMHEDAIDALEDTGMGGEMDPSDDVDDPNNNPTQDGGRAVDEPGLSRPNDPGVEDATPGGTQDRSWSGQ